MPSNLESTLSLHIRAILPHINPPTTEYRFHNKRRWRFDFAWPEHMIAVEVEGGVYSKGRHTRGSGFTKDCEKYNEATLLGWRVFRFTGKMVTDGEAIQFLERLFSEV